MDVRFIQGWRRSLGIAVILGILLGNAAHAADLAACSATWKATAPLTLTAAIDAALCHNVRTTTAWQAIQARSADVGIARASSLPTVSGSLSAQDSRTHASGDPGSSNRSRGLGGSMGVNWRVFDFGERAANQAAAARLLEAAVASRDDAIRKTVADTVQAYFAAVQARATFEARQEAIQRAERTVAAARRREERGIAGRSDTLQAETALARARLSSQRAQADVDGSLASLSYTIGAPVDAPPTLPARIQPGDDTPAPDLAPLLDEARNHHPAILAARAQRDADERKVVATRSQGRPTIDLSLTQQRNPSGQAASTPRSSTLAALITVNIPIFDGYSSKYQIQRAQAQAETSGIQAIDTEQQVMSELVKAVSEVRTARASMEPSRQLLQAATASVESAENRYQRGVGDILELLAAQNALGEALEAQAQCESQWHAARLKLLADIGQWHGDAVAPSSLPPPPLRQ